MLAIEPSTTALLAGIAALANVGVALLLGLFTAANRRRTTVARTGDAHFARTLKGYEDLLDAQDERIDGQDARIKEMEAEMARMRDDVRIARREAYRASAHAGECENELRQARARIEQLERNSP